MKQVEQARQREPLLAALDAAEAAINGTGAPEERISRALVVLADALAGILAESDSRSSTMQRGTGARGVLDRFRSKQADRIVEIRALATEAMRSTSANLPEISKRARKASRSTLRNEVRKRRIRRGERSDVPGGES